VKKLPFLKNERLSRLMTSLLLCMGLLLPLMMTFNAGGAMMQAVMTACIVLAVFWVLGNGRRGRLVLCVLVAVAAALQLLFDRLGFFGRAFEALKAIALYFNEAPGAAVLYQGDIALLFGVVLAMVSYAFASRNAGFFPATILVVLMLFGMWSLGRAEYLWLSTPAFVALLLLVSQTSHEKVNLFEVLPMAAIVVAVAMLILPAGQTVIKPMHEAAMKLKQTITDYLFFTEPRNVFTLGSYGYYPMGSGKLGGPITPSDTPVMTVKTDRKTLLRAVVRDEYTGRSWRDTSDARRYLYVNPRWSSIRSRVFLENMPLTNARANEMLAQYAVSVQMQDTATSTVFTPVFLRRFSAMSDMVAYFNEASELFITRDLQRGDRYTVYAPLIQGGDSALGALIQTVPKGTDAYYQTALENYTALPSHMEQKVFDDLWNIVANAQTPYDRACAIQRHLQRYYRYTLEPETPPENQDFVTYFLYVGKEGYCTYFASAMTVMCRMAGLPARYVEGFLAKPDAEGFAYVIGENAHAWTEVYFEGFGWVPFDATPSQDEQDDPNPPPQEPEPTPTPTPTPPPQDEEDQPTATPEPPENNSDEPEDQPEEPEDKPPFPWWIILVLLVIAGLCLRIISCLPNRVADRAHGDLNKVFVYGNAAYAIMLLKKRTPRPGETPLSFARRMDRQKAFPEPILPLWRMMALSNYSPAQPGPEQTAQARSLFGRLYAKQRWFIKLRFVLWAAFGRGCYTCLDTQMKHEEPVSAYKMPAQKKNPSGRRKKSNKTTEES